MGLLREPLLHFVAAGALLFGLWSLVHRDGAGRDGKALGRQHLSSVINVTDADLRLLQNGFRAASKREPDQGEVADLVEQFIAEEILFREALSLGLDRDDGVVRRRLVEKMTALARPTAPTSDPGRDELLRWYHTYRHRFLRRTTVSFDHVFFDPARRKDAGTDAAQALTRLQAEPAEPPSGVGDPFPWQGQTTNKSEVELGHLFGEGLARLAMSSPIGTWAGPARSRMGVHLLRVTDRQAARLPEFAEVEKQVRADWLTVQTRGLRTAAKTVLPKYRVELSDSVRARVESQPGMASYLGTTPNAGETTVR